MQFACISFVSMDLRGGMRRKREGEREIYDPVPYIQGPRLQEYCLGQA